jgi:hypothetical protein
MSIAPVIPPARREIQQHVITESGHIEQLADRSELCRVRDAAIGQGKELLPGGIVATQNFVRIAGVVVVGAATKMRCGKVLIRPLNEVVDSPRWSEDNSRPPHVVKALRVIRRLQVSKGERACG